MDLNRLIQRQEVNRKVMLTVTLSLSKDTILRILLAKQVIIKDYVCRIPEDRLLEQLYNRNFDTAMVYHFEIINEVG